MVSEGRGRPPPVILDANLLYPFHLRNLLVQLGVGLTHHASLERLHPSSLDRLHP
jgi:hypothetical protein